MSDESAELPCDDCDPDRVRPFRLLPRPRTAVTASDVLARLPGSMETVIDGQLLVFHPDTGQSNLLNTSAALVFTSVDGRSSVGRIIEELAHELGLERSVLDRDVPDALTSLLDAGLIGPTPDRAAPAVDRAAPAVDPGDVSTPGLAGTSPESGWDQVVRRRLDAHGWSRTLGPFTAAGARLVVRVDDDELVAGLSDALAQLAMAPSRPPGDGDRRSTSAGGTDPVTAIVSIDSRPVADGRRYRVHADTARFGWTDDPRRAVRYALAAVNQLAAAHTPGRILLHAGAVERDGRVIVITGMSGRGKTTLTAALVAAGWGYVTDELAAVDPSTGRVEPYPKALDLDDVALDLLGLVAPDPPEPAGRADLAGGAPTEAIVAPTHEHAVSPASLGRASTGGRLAAIVVLVGAGGEVATPLDPAAALTEVLIGTFPATWEVPGALDVLAGFCQDLPVVRLPRVPLEQAVRVVADLA